MTPRGDERGSGGAEVLPFGVLVFVVGLLVVGNAWGVVDANFAVAGAAREAARAYVEANDGDEAVSAATRAAREALAGYGRATGRMRVDITAGASFHRCTRVVVEVSYDVPAIALPWGAGFGSAVTARAIHSELVDPYRRGVPLAPGEIEVRCA